ncbi:MAG: IS481 family transposase [Actinobacteria bacterium]|nr:IS481 family transposase [Actinomycetota bacterium]
MSKRRLVITAVVVQGLSQAETARRYGVSQGWVSRLVARWRLEGEAAFEARSRRPHRSPTATSTVVVDRVLGLRKTLTDAGLDAGPHSICWHLQHGPDDLVRPADRVRVAPATVWRVLHRHGLVIPEPKKRPKASLRRFEAELPNLTWQTDVTHVRLADGTDAEVLSFLDDHSRFLLASAAFRTVTGPRVVQVLRQAIDRHGPPASVLSDNGLVFTTRFAGSAAGRGNPNGFQKELATRGITQKNSSPAHPQTCGKIERWHSTLKRWLAAHHRAATVTELQTQLDTFRDIYNTRRPHRAIGRRTPAAAYTALPKAGPGDLAANPTDTQHRVRTDTIDTSGTVTIRYHGRLHHIGIGRTHAGTHVLMLVQDRHVTVIHKTTGEVLRELTLDPTKDYQPRGPRPGPKTNRPEPP